MTKTDNWTKEEFKAYLLIYAAQTNFIEAEEELEFIETRFNKDVINKIRKEIKDLNDYQRVQIIIDYIKFHDYSQNDLDNILLEIKELYKSDGVYDTLEKSIYFMLEKLLIIQ